MAKITENELQRISAIKKDALELASFLGELEYQKTLLDFQTQEVKTNVKALRDQERKLFDELKGSYGNININLETGEYTEIN
jgi:catalase (peroxidase I)